jgi:hypothetical protein
VRVVIFKSARQSFEQDCLSKMTVRERGRERKRKREKEEERGLHVKDDGARSSPPLRLC